MPTSSTAEKIKHLRQEYERGLLSIIVDANRRDGFALMDRTVGEVAALTVAPAQWQRIRQWLLAQQSGQLSVTRDTFALLRDLGRVLKYLDHQADKAGHLPLGADVLLTPLLIRARMDLTPVESVSHLEANWLQALQNLVTAFNAWHPQSQEHKQPLAKLRECFAQVHEFAQSLSWDDAKEISDSLMNMLDRLLDGTLAATSDHPSVAWSALVLLESLSVPKADSPQDSQIDDATYERVIERADVLASGGSFAGADPDPLPQGVALATDSTAASVNAQLATVLEAIPPLVADTLGERDDAPTDQELRADLSQLAHLAQKLLGRFDPG